MLVSRKFASIVEDPAACARAQASAARALVEFLADADAPADCDGGAVAVAADWAVRILNSHAFFTMHPTLVLQVLSSHCNLSSPFSSNSTFLP